MSRTLRWEGEDDRHMQYEAFVALTRARVWCVETGLESPVFEELRREVELAPELVFPAFNRRWLRRVTDDTEPAEATD
jgi:hypothetical protein